LRDIASGLILNLKLIFVFLTLFTSIVSAQQSKHADSIRKYIFLSNDKVGLSDSIRLEYAKLAYQNTRKFSRDTLQITAINNLMGFESSTASDNFKKLNLELVALSLQQRDSANLAQAYYNLGKHYSEALNIDSSYYYLYEAEKTFKAINDDWNTSQVLLSIANIQRNEKDFTGSEILSFEALSLLDKLPSNFLYTRKKAFVYNNLGMVFHELGQYQDGIKYHKQALSIKESLSGDNSVTIDNSKNNLANVYRDAGEYETANTYYKSILDKQSVRKERPDTYALILDNYAYNLFLSKNHEQLPNLYHDALKLCDSVGADYFSIVVNQHLAEYYHAYKNKDSAKYYAYRAKELSEKYHNDDLLKSLLILSEVEDDSLAVKYYEDYITLNDSIQKNERKLRDKFFRIRYETNKIEKEKDRIARERLWLIILLLGLVFTFFLVYVIITQRSKNKELKFVQQQQETNEEIYNLMLSQQEQIDEARALEKKRISEELHDGILGRLFGTRLSLDSLNMNPSPDAIKTRGTYIEQLKDIEQDIRKVSHDLNTDFIANSGFLDIIKTLVETQTTAYGLNYELQHDDSIIWDEVSNKTKIHIYRIIQESLQNIYKHAEASTVKISFKLKNNVIWLAILDNGSGFDVNKAKKGIGLKNIHSRAKEIDARVSIDSTKEQGTVIELFIPVNHHG